MAKNSFAAELTFNEEIDDMEDIFKIDYQGSDEVVLLIAQAVIGITTSE